MSRVKKTRSASLPQSIGALGGAAPRPPPCIARSDPQPKASSISAVGGSRRSGAPASTSSRGAACARPAGPLTIAQVAGRIAAPRGLDAASRAVRSAMEGSAGRALRHQRAAGAARMRNPAEAGRSVLWEVAGWAALARAAAARARAASQKPVPR